MRSFIVQDDILDYVDSINFDESGFCIRYTPSREFAHRFSGEDWEAFWKAESGVRILDEEE